MFQSIISSCMRAILSHGEGESACGEWSGVGGALAFGGAATVEGCWSCLVSWTKPTRADHGASGALRVALVLVVDNRTHDF